MTKYRSLEDITADPQASAADMELLVRARPFDALMHGNCPVEAWWQLAPRYPLYYTNSAAYPLMALESPERLLTMERQNASDWLRRRLSSAQQTWWVFEFMADCLERVLPAYETVFPGDPRVAEAIDLLREGNASAGAGQLGWREMKDQITELFVSLQGMDLRYADFAARERMRCAIHMVDATRRVFTWSFAMATIEAARAHFAATDMDEFSQGFDTDFASEQLWQWFRYAQYFREHEQETAK